MLKEKSKSHLHGNSLLSRLRTICVVEGGVGVGEEFVLGVLVEHQHLRLPICIFQKTGIIRNNGVLVQHQHLAR